MEDSCIDCSYRTDYDDHDKGICWFDTEHPRDLNHGYRCNNYIKNNKKESPMKNTCGNCSYWSCYGGDNTAYDKGSCLNSNNNNFKLGKKVTINSDTCKYFKKESSMETKDENYYDQDQNQPIVKLVDVLIKILN